MRRPQGAARNEMKSERDPPSVLLLGDRALGALLAAAFPGTHVRTADSRAGIEQALASGAPDLVVADCTQPWVQDLPPGTLRSLPGDGRPTRIELVPEDGDAAAQRPSASALAALVDAVGRELTSEGQNPRDLQESDDWSLFEGMPTGLFRSTPDGRILDANPALVQMLGFPSKDDLLGQNAIELYLQPEDRARIEDELKARGVVQSAEVCLRRRDGTLLWVEEFARTVRGPGGVVRYYEGTLIDITARKRADKAIQRREAILKAVAFAGEQFLQKSPWTACMDDVLAHIGHAADASRAYLFAFHLDDSGQPAASQRFEWAAPGIEMQIDHPGLQNLPRRHGGFARWAAMLETKEVVVGRMAEFTQAEQEMLAGQDIRSLLLAPIFVEGACWGFLGFDDCLEDRLWSEGEIEALKAAASALGAAIMRQNVDDALWRLQEFNESLLLSMAEGIVVDDADGRVIFANPAALKTLGYPLEELIGTHWTEFIPADEHDKVKQANTRRAGGGHDAYEIDVLRKGGARFPVIASGSPRFEKGTFAGTMAVFTDIGERKRAEAAMAQRARELAALYETSIEINAQQSLPNLLRAIVERAAGLVGTRTGSLYLMRPDHQSLEMVVRLGGKDLTGTVLSLGEGASGRVAASGQPLAIADYATWEGHLETFADIGLRRLLSIPLKYQGRVLGVINITDEQAGEAFGEDQLRIVSLFADQAAIAIANARLLEAERSRSVELARSRGLLAALSQVAAEVEHTYDPEQVLQTLAREVRKVGLNFWLGFTDRESDGILIRYSSLQPEVLERARKLLGVSKDGLFVPRKHLSFFEDVVIRRRPVAFDAESELQMLLPGSPRRVRDTIYRLAGATGGMKSVCLPLIVGDQTVGVLSMWGEGLADEDMTPYTVFASQVASAMEKSSLLDETRRRASYLEAVTRVASALRAANTRQEMQAIALDQIIELLEAEGACVAMLAPHSGEIVFEAARRRWTGLKGKRVPATEGVAGKVISTGEAVVRDDVEKSSDSYEFELLRKVRSLACVPLSVQDKPIGCLMIGRDSPIQPADLRLLTAVGEMIGNAIHRAGMLATLEQRVADRTRELKEANIRLRELDSIKSEFVTNVSHELRTPITNILLYLDLVDQPLEDERRSEYVAILKKESDRLGRLIEDLLTLSRIERGVLPLDFQPHALDPLIAEVIAAHEARASAKGIQLSHELNPTLPVVLVSREQILQVFTNLVGNALAYSPPGGQVAMCSEIWLEDGQARVAVRVRNEGPPIPAEDLSRIFERFFRGKTAQQTGEPGTGLGLPISREIVERHGGTIDVSSTAAEGTTFTVWLPADSRP